jgi:hypothetical protein
MMSPPLPHLPFQGGTYSDFSDQKIINTNTGQEKKDRLKQKEFLYK